MLIIGHITFRLNGLVHIGSAKLQNEHCVMVAGGLQANCIIVIPPFRLMYYQFKFGKSHQNSRSPKGGYSIEMTS